MSHTASYQSCNTSSLARFVPSQNNPWDIQKVKHIHNRLGFGVNWKEAKEALQKTPNDYIDKLIEDAINYPKMDEPKWVSLDAKDYDANGFGDFSYLDLLRETRYSFTKEIYYHSVKGRLMLFWHNHLVTNSVDYVFPGYGFRYIQIIEKYALGNFKEFVNEMGKSEAMLRYLNGYENVAGNPNENYARELYELFTLGEGNNYTEKDITETSRALTGYNHYTNGGGSRIVFKPETFDSTEKTIFEQKGNWNYDDVINILFEQRAEQIGKYICEKLYKYFVSPSVTDEIRSSIIIPLGKVFVDNNFEIIPVLKKLFKSEHFFDINAQRCVIRSPHDNVVGLLKDTGFNFGDWDEYLKTRIVYRTTNVGQELLKPPTVAGWSGDKEWINSGVFARRISNIVTLIHRAYSVDKEQLRELAITISENSKDPEFIVKQFFNLLFNEQPYSKIDFQTALDAFKSRVPSNYFENNIWNLQHNEVPLQVRDLLIYTSSLPDFQLK